MNKVLVGIGVSLSIILVLFLLDLLVPHLFADNYLWSPRPAVILKAEQPKSATLAYETQDYKVYCEEPNGNEIYVATYGTSAGVGVSTFVVPGGCK